jgi:7-carboxy-7-deazaguanine synthase (Cx14CxxC type)
VTYAVKEIFFTLQGEGANTGRPAVFCRFAGCNLWTGRERDRAAATCRFCDTDFVGVDGPGGGKFEDAPALARAVAERWPANMSPGVRPLVVCTGGEPLLQMDDDVVHALHARGFEIAVETNGTQRPPADIDWLCVSPKAGAPLVLTHGSELKLVYPQDGAEPSQFAHLHFEQFFLQPMDGPDRERNTELALAYCLAHPQWRLSIQTHKLLGIP